MHAQLKNGSLRLRLGARFGAPEAERACETVQAFASLRQLTLDFADVGELGQSACAAVAKMLAMRLARKLVLLRDASPIADTEVPQRRLGAFPA
jgi:hypothetical protein